MPGMHMLPHTPAAVILDQRHMLSRLTNRTVLTEEALVAPSLSPMATMVL